MLMARLVKPETLDVDGATYSAGDGLPLTKGQAQQLAKALRRNGIEAEFTYENRADDQLRGRHDAEHKDAPHGDPGAGNGADVAGQGRGATIAMGGERPRRGRPRKSGL